MTFPAHKFSGGALHLLLGAMLLWIISLLIGAVGYGIPLPVIIAIAYLSFASGSYVGGFPDTEDWIVANVVGARPRWETYHRAHITDLKERYGWMPAWTLHLFADTFVHQPKNRDGSAKPPKWWEMDPAWRERELFLGLTLWDVHYSYREFALWVIGALMLWAAIGILVGLI
ncbi:MAG: hypothetical protein AB1428_12895 [Bacteroidota bacterium]